MALAFQTRSTCWNPNGRLVGGLSVDYHWSTRLQPWINNAYPLMDIDNPRISMDNQWMDITGYQWISVAINGLQRFDGLSMPRAHISTQSEGDGSSNRDRIKTVTEQGQGGHLIDRLLPLTDIILCLVYD